MSIVYFIDGKLQEREERRQLALHAMASRGDAKKVNALISGKKG